MSAEVSHGHGRGSERRPDHAHTDRDRRRVILDAYGIRVTLAEGWSGRIYSRIAGAATLHAGDFALALEDGEFGDRSTGRMPAGATFLALTEYRVGTGLEPGRGLFAARRLPLPLDPTAFASNRLAHARPGQVGAQFFFTTAGRPFCLYMVIAGPRDGRRQRLLAADHVLRTLHIDRRVG